MELDLVTILIFFAVLLITFLVRWKPESDIPGPTAWPMIGNLSIFKEIQKHGSMGRTISLLAKQYGPIFRLYLGPHVVVFICDYNTIRQVLKQQAQDFIDRPLWLPFVKMLRKVQKGSGFAWNNGDSWKNVRRLSLRSMKDFGLGKFSLEETILEEAGNIIETFEKLNGKPVNNVRDILTKATCNVIHHVIFGYRYKHDHEKLKEIIDCFHVVFEEAGPLSTDAVFPFLKILFSIEKSRHQRRCLETIAKYVTEQTEEHKHSYDENNICDFVDLYIKSETCKDDRQQKLDKCELFSIIIDLFAAGTDTTSTTLDWALLFMIANPTVQRKCQEEISKVVGTERKVRYSDRTKLCYVEATLLEVQRLGNTAVGTLPHMATCDTTIVGYKIKEGTIVMPMMSVVHKDPTLWNDPEQFDPSRFIDDNGDVLKKETLIPFGSGPRACPGESLAKTEMFLIFANLLQRFTFSKTEPGDILSFKGITGITNAAPPYRLTAVLR